MKKHGCAIAFVAFLSIFLALGITMAVFSGKTPVRDTVTLRAASGATHVQMFDGTTADATAMHQFPSGTECTRINGPTSVTLEGVAVRFYKLACNGTMGYVNAQWVR